MEIFKIYQVFVVLFGTTYGRGMITPNVLYGALVAGLGIWLALFILQGIGLYTMAKNRNMEKRWLAFMPFANIWYMGKLTGTCNVFGQKMKRPGLYVMLASLISFLLCAATAAVEVLLYTKYSGYIVQTESGYDWTGLTGGALYAYNYYNLSDYFIYIFQLVYSIFLFILLTGLYKKYYARGYLLLSWVALFLPISRYIAIFVLRKNKAIDYEAYVRAKREEFLRRQQQNPYGFNPYNQGPYQGPYSQNPYGQGPYNQNPYGQNPNGYNQAPPNGGQGNAGADDPFSEFAPGAAGADKKDENRENTKSGGDSDDLFN